MGNLQNNFIWSLGRVQRYRRCPRQYYFCHYAFWDGWKYDSPEMSKLCYFLKNLTNCNLFIGDITHIYIARIFAEALNPSKCGNLESMYTDKAKLYKSISAEVNSKFDVSNLRLRGKTAIQIIKSGIKLKNIGFFEHYSNSIKLERETIFRKSITNQIYTNLWSFLNSEIYKFALKNLIFSKEYCLPYRIEKEILDFETDTFLHSWNGYNISCFAKPDFYFTTKNNQVVVLDWKTGWKYPNSVNDSITPQLMLYGYKLYKELAEKVKNYSSFNFEAYEVYLPSCNLVGGVLTDYHFKNITTQIDEEIVLMSKLLVEEDIKLNKPKNIDKFEQCSNEDICKCCNYMEMCNDSDMARFKI
jgi:hypothetical protein